MHLVNSVPVARTVRVRQLEGLFDIAVSERSEVAWDVDLPLDERPWHIGLIVGPSGSGKSTIAKGLWPDHLVTDMAWDPHKSITDAFPDAMGVKEIVELLSGVGFSSPPAWLRPYHALSTGEQFRVTMARALAESPALVVMDEFTSVVDRRVAQVASAALAKAIRMRKQQFVAVTVHYDVMDWLQPDWVYEPHIPLFTWRELQRRPPLTLVVRPCASGVWSAFRLHHYLDHHLHRAAKCYLGMVDEALATFTAVLPFPHAKRPGWREHRTVCLPDFQGVGLGNAMSEFVAGLYRSTGRPYFSSTSHPGMMRHRARSPLWKMVVAPSYRGKAGKTGLHGKGRAHATKRLMASFEYVGPARPDEARSFGIAVGRYT